MLYVVAWPLLSEAHDTALRRLRAQYHPTEAALIGPHFTLVFGAPLDREDELRAKLASLAFPPFWFVIERIVRVDKHLFAQPVDGSAELVELYDHLNPMQRGHDPFEPHITLGLFERAQEAEQVARIVERQHMPMHGRVEELALLRRQDNRVETLASVRLTG